MTFDYSHEIESCARGALGGTPVADCACGRTNFAPSDDCMDEGELDAWLAKAQAAPAKYHQHAHGDSVCVMVFNGRTRVFGCACHWEKELCKLLDQNDDLFLNYYRRRHARRTQELAEDAKRLEGLPA